jgi:hypothetical protein
MSTADDKPLLAFEAERQAGIATPPSGLEVRPAPGKGRGVFATRSFARGEVVELAPVLALRPGDVDAALCTVLGSYVFAWRGTVAVGLGFASIYNHAWDPNLHYFKRFEAGLLEFVAARDIAAGDELTINYTSSNPHRADLWAALD